MASLPDPADLPDSDGIPLDNQLHRELMELLIGSLRPWLGTRGYAGANMFVYYVPPHDPNASAEQPAHRNCGPDVFVALDVSPRVRKKWVCWHEGKVPDVVIEFLSESTRDYDQNGKKMLYQDSVRVPEYYWYDPYAPEQFAGFTLENGVYIPIEPDAHGRLPSQRLQGLRLGRWQGRFNDIDGPWLRWYTDGGDLLSTPEESQAQRADAADARANAADERADAADARADAADARADALARQLRALGINPNLV